MSNPVAVKNLGVSKNKVKVKRPLSSYKLPPGPRIDSKEADFILNEKLIYKKIVQKYMPKYGPIVTLFKDEVPVIFINDVDTGYDVFVRKFSKQVSGRQANYGEKILSGNRNNILNSDYGPLWKVLQRNLHKGLRHCANLDRIDEIMYKCFDKFKESVEYSRGSKNGGIKVDDDLFWMADNVITMLLFNEIFNDADYTKYQKAIEVIPQYAEECDFLDDKPTKKSDFKSIEQLQKVFNQLVDVLQKRIDEHRKRGDYKIACFDITDFTLLAIEEYHLDPKAKKLGIDLTDLHVKHSLIDVIFASQEGLGNSFVWLLGLLALYPNIQEKIRAEINKFRDDSNVQVTLQWKSKMPYTNAVLCEIQRFASADTFTDFHSVMEDITIGPYEIPADSLLVLNLYAIHHDKKRWNNPNVIDPQNFLTEDGQTFKRRKDFVPYGLGLRTCVGNTFSENVLFVLIMLFVDNYKLVWGKNKSQEIIDDNSAVFIRDVEPFNIQFIHLK